MDPAVEEILRLLVDDKDSLEIGGTKDGKLKVYGNFAMPDDFKKKVDNAIDVLKHARAGLAGE